MPDPRARRAEVEAYLARSRRVRRLTTRAGLGLVAVAVVLGAVGMPGAPVYGVGLVGLAVAGAGAWITWGHIQEFERELAASRHARRSDDYRR